jgi:hypothetical protein
VLRLSLGPLAPYLIGLFFVFTLAVGSNGELIRARDLLIPIGSLIVVAGLAQVGAWLLTRDAMKAALIAWVLVVAFSSFGILLGISGWTGALGPTLTETVLLLLYGIATAGLVLAISQTTRALGTLLAYVAVTSALVAGWNGVLATRSLHVTRHMGRALPPSGITAPPFTGRQPDVLLLILDKYAGSRTLADQYGFDNRAFEAFLRGRGFLVPSTPRANYVQTFLALAAFLNLTYLDSLIARIGPESRDRAPHYAAIERNRLAAFFRERGYRFVFLPTALGATRQNRLADLQLPDPTAIRPEFVTAWFQTTPVPTLHRLFCVVATCVMPPPYVPETATMLDWKFEQLAQLAGQEQPLFVLAHLTLPHEPYLYRANCQHRPPYWPTQDDGADAAEIRAAYLAQIRCLNSKLEALIIAWQARALVPPVILLQADHGHGQTGRYVPAAEALSPAQVADRVSVFAAYLVPGSDPSALPDTVTPINAMRFMLRHTFRADLPPLEDATYWSAFTSPNALERVR